MKQYDSIEAFAADLPGLTADLQSKLQGNDGLFLLKLKSGKEYSVRLQDGLASVNMAEDGEPDCTVTADEGTLLDMINGKGSPVKALLFGKVSVKGDVFRLKKLLSLL